MRKALLQLALTLLCANFAHAYDDYSDDNYCPPECSYENGCGTFSAGADWLYWKVEEQKLLVGSHVTVTSVGPDATVHSQLLKPNFKTSSGYRIFADYTTPNHLWKVVASFTHVPSDAGFNQVGNLANINTDFVTVFPSNFPLLNAVVGNNFVNLSGDWDIDINTFDVDLSRTLFLHKCFEIKPHIGIRGQWIDQTYKIAGSGVDGELIPAPVAFISTVKGKLKGIGLEGGLWGRLNAGYGFSVLGHIGGSIVYAKSEEKQTLTNTTINGTQTINYSEEDNISLPGMDAFVGLAYTTNCYNKTINLHVGWEHHAILNVNQFSLDHGGDLTMQGLTLGGSISF